MRVDRMHQMRRDKEVRMQTMERRGFLKLTLGIAAAAAVAGATTPSQAMPVLAPADPQSPKTEATPEPAVATPKDVEDATVENVQWWRWRRRRYFVRRPWRWRRWRRW
jgi:hypothetical protein